MAENVHHIDVPKDLAGTLRDNPEAATIWAELPEAHRRGHIIAIQRITGTGNGAEEIEHTIDHLFEKHGPGERYDVVWTAREPGRWLLHCHIPHHTTNNNVDVRGGGGLTMIIDVSG